MAKRDKLYTVNKWNKPFFEEERRKKLFLWGGDSLGIKPGLNEGLAGMRWGYGNTWGSDYVAPVSSLTKQNSIDRAVKDFNQYSNPSYYQNLAKVQVVSPKESQGAGLSKTKQNSEIVDFMKDFDIPSAMANTEKFISTANQVAPLNPTTSPPKSTPKATGKIIDNALTGTTANGTAFSFPISSFKGNIPAFAGSAEVTAREVKHASDMIAKDMADVAKTPAKGISGLGKAGINLGASVLGKGAKYLLSNGFSTDVGEGIGTFADAASTMVQFIPGVGWVAAPLISFIGNALAGAYNGAFGTLTFDNGATAYTNRLNSLNPNGSNEYLANLLASTGIGPRATYRDGWLRDKGENEAAAINNAQDLALTRFQRGVRDAFGNNNWNQLQYALNDHNVTAMGGKLNKCKCNKKSYGGYLDSATPTGFNFLSDLTNIQMQKNQNQGDTAASVGNSFMNTPDVGITFAKGGIMIKPENRGKLTRLKKRTGKTEAELYNDGNPEHRKMVVFARNARKWKKALGGKINYGEDKDIRNNSFLSGQTMYDLGGILQASGSNWGNVSQINEGGTHEENPYEGVQVGVDPEGTPNLVEEGEVIWNDYVFSNRITVPKEVCKRLRIGQKKNGYTFADAAKKLLVESKERPNDPISKNGLEANMQLLEDAQEEVKRKMEAEQAVEQFNSLPPEQQVAIMNQEGQRAQDAVAQEQMAQEIQNMPPEQQQAIAQQMMAEQAAAQGLGVPQGQPSPEEQAMMQQQMAQQQTINPQEAIAQASAMQQQALGGMALGGKLCFGGRKFAEGGELNGEQPTEQTDNEMAKYSDEELQDMIDDYQEAESGEVKVTKGKLARLKKKAEKAEAELERRHAEENEEQPQEARQEPSQEELQAAAQAQAMLTLQPIEGQPQEGMSPEQAMMMQQQMGGQPLMSPEEMAAMELQQQGNGQYAYGGRLYLTGGELLQALGFTEIDDSTPITLEDLGITNWYDEIDPTQINTKKIYSKVTDPKIKQLIAQGYDPLNPPENTDRWFESDNGEIYDWGEASRFKNGYTRLDLEDMSSYLPYLQDIITRLDDNDYDWSNKLSPQDLMKQIQRDKRWRDTNIYLRSDQANRRNYLARIYDQMETSGKTDASFIDTWTKPWKDKKGKKHGPIGEFKFNEATGKYDFIINKDQEGLFDERFWEKRSDGLLGRMYNIRVPAKTAPQNYELDENGNPTGKIIINTNGYTQVGNPYSFYTKDDNNPYAPYINNQITYWKKGSASGNDETDDESRYLKVGWKPKTNITDYILGGLPGFTGLTFQIAQGKPDTSGLDAAAAFVDKYAGIMAPPHLTHGLMTPAITDPRVTHNIANASRLGVNRILRNTGSAPSQAASILANDTNYQHQMGQNDLRDWLANREQEQKATTFNENVARANATFLNDIDKFNAQMIADAGQKSAQIRYNAELEKLNQNNAYRAGLLGNIGSMMTGLYNAYREGQNRNERDLLIASEVFGPTNGLIDDYYGIPKIDPKTGMIKRGPDTGKYWYNGSAHSQPPLAISYGAEGGKLRKKSKKRKGYTF